MKDLDNNNIYGIYYRCCIPCNCDLMKYARVEKINISFRDGYYDYHVLTINDPCLNGYKYLNQLLVFNVITIKP